MYLTYEQYREYGGELAETAFNNLEFEAEGIVNRYTFNRLMGESNIPEAVGRVVYQLISALDQRNKALTLDGVVVSRSNDGVSESRAAMSPDNVYTSLSAQLGDIVLTGLSGVKDARGRRLLYRGFYRGE